MYKNIKKKINRDVENVNNDNKYMYVKDVHDGCPTSSAAFKTLKKSFNKLFLYSKMTQYYAQLKNTPLFHSDLNSLIKFYS